MATSRKPFKGASSNRQMEDIKVSRIPLIGNLLFRGTTTSKDQRFVNCFFEVSKNPETQKVHYYLTKRPGLTSTGGIRPPAGNAVGRGVYSWNGKLYSVSDNKIYSGTTDLGVTLTTTTGICGFAEVRPGAGTLYLGINDGVKLYLISTSDVVTTVSAKSATVTITNATPAVISWTTHGLLAGAAVMFTTTGALPSPIVAGTVYYVISAGLSASAFEIALTAGGSAINTTDAGSGTHTGTTKYPTPNTRDLVYMDGYFLVFKTDGTIWNCTVDDPTTWEPSRFITAMMYGGAGVGIVRQNNYLLALSDRATQAFYDAANSAGSPLTNVEQALQQLGCATQGSIAGEEGTVVWISNSFTGGYSIFKLDGVTSLKEIATPEIQRILNAEGTSISSATAMSMRTAGKFLYILNLASCNRTFVYDHGTDLWTEWETAAGSAVWPIVSSYQHLNTLVCQHATNGWLYILSPTCYQDAATNFTVLARLSRVDFETLRWKTCKRVDLIGDVQGSTTPVSVQYSDDDYVTLSTTRTFDMVNTQCFGVNFGRFQRRAWQVSYTGNNPLRMEALELRVRMGDS